MPSRSALVIACSDGAVAATGNATMSRAALSTSKLYLAEHVLSRPGVSDDEIALVERMIARSDDRAADILDAQHPSAIDSVAYRYGLQDTVRMDHWGTSRTSAADLVAFLQQARESRAGREVLDLMTSTRLVAADGEIQDWGAARLQGVTGVKLGWSDWGEPTVASVGFGDGFIVAGSTIGSREQHTVDIESAMEGSCVDSLN
ncbi:serine hydrolase family protein [Lolliginicoccus suaedae]|uniref:serine hydrolase n=1 Tax=Lolliginicoccus suaedae TaxID=2605429 RepID=UPI0011EDF00C|nr:serine hydrolase [Lolliginicoccus suaedae]